MASSCSTPSSTHGRREAGASPSRRRAQPISTWAPEHPLEGRVDRLSRLQLRSGSIEGFRNGVPLARVLVGTQRRLALIKELERRIRRGAVRAEPAVATLLVEESERATRTLANRASLRASLAPLSRLRRKLYPYQREGIERFLQTGRLLLADDMGLGKTTQAIAACHACSANGRVARGLLIVPAASSRSGCASGRRSPTRPLQLVDGRPEERARLYAATRSAAS